MLNCNLNIIEPLQQEKKNEDFNPYVIWTYTAKSSANDNNNLPPNSNAVMNINAPASNCVNVTVTSNNQFGTDPDFMVTASVAGTTWAVTGSTTMSLDIVGISANATQAPYYYNAAVSASRSKGNINSISGSVLKNSFTASEFYNYFINGNIIHYKENPYNSDILWLTKTNGTQPNGKGTNTPVIFNVNSDTNLIVGPIIVSGANAENSGSTSNDYAFSITASLTGSTDWWDDEWYVWTTMSLSVPEASVSASSNVTSSKIATPFVVTNDNPYTITASVDTRAERLLINTYVVGGGGGGGYGGGTANTLIGIGSGGGAGQIVSSSFYIIPNLPVAATIGVGGNGGTSSTGSEGSKSTINYYVGPNLTDGKTTLTANSGSGGQMNGPGGKSGDGFIGGPVSSSGACPTNNYQSWGGGGGGTVETGYSGSGNSQSGNGGNFLGGGGGASNLAGRENGAPTPLGFLGLTGRGGRGGYLGDFNTIIAPNSSTAFGGGGGGAVGNCTTTRVGGNGGNGIVVVTHEGTTQKLTYSGTYTTAVTGSTFYYYLVGNGNLTWIVN